MLYIGMDVHQDHTVFCLFDPAAEPAQQYRYVKVPTTQEDLERVLRPLAGCCKLAFEVGLMAQWVAQIVRPLAAEVQVVNPSRMPWLFRDGRKNDRLDAYKIVHLLYLNQLPQVHLPRAEIALWRSLINHRRSRIKRRTMVKCQLRSLLRARALRCPHRSLWTKKGLAWLKSLAWEPARMWMRNCLLNELEFLERSIDELEQQLDAIAKDHPTVALLRTIPGIGPRSAEALVAYGDFVQRFPDRKRFASYFGLTPTQDASGRIDRHGHISKRGPSVVRWVLVEAVHQVVRRSKVFREYFNRIARDKKDRRKKAIVAAARKLLTVVYAMWRDNRPFDPARVLKAA